MVERIEHTQKSYNIRKEAKEFPMMCVLSFVYICNGKCPNCPYTNSNIRQSYQDTSVMPEDIFKIIAEQCGKYGAYIRLSGGGEPMLHPQAVELVEYAKKVKAKVGLITNGSAFTESSLYKLISAGIDLIEFSVDAGDEVTYNKVRRGLNWGNLLKNVRCAVEIRDKLRSPTKIIASAINQKGVNVKEAKQYWLKIVDKVQIRKYLTWGYNKDLSADPTPYLEPEESIPCPWLFERLNIDSRGDVTICGEDIAFREKFGNVKDKSIKELWYSSKFEYYRKKHLERKGDEIEICRSCPDWKYRSWNYNYWKVVDDAGKKRLERLTRLQETDVEGEITEEDGE